MILQGKTALITGAAKRIGRQIALSLASDGAVIVIHYRDSRKEAETLREEIQGLGSEAFLIQHDFSSGASGMDSVKKFTRNLSRLAPPVDILVNNASIYYPVAFKKIRQKDWNDFMRVNLEAPFFLAREIGMKMFKRKAGKIINLTDWSHERPSADYLPYHISKAGLAAATKGLAKALAPHVTVASVAPGPILPPVGGKAGTTKGIAAKTLLKRFGRPEDIAAAVQFLIQTDYITGAVIPVTGGSEIF
jgi:pteridine reductase